MGARHVGLRNGVNGVQGLGEVQRSVQWAKGSQVWSGRHWWWGRPADPERVGGSRQPAKPQQQAGDGKRESQEKQGFAKVVKKRELQPVIMAAAAKVAKRVPLIKFPNRKASETQGAVAVAVNRPSGGGGQSQAMSSLPSGTASSQPPRTKLTKAEIEAILLGGAAP